MIYSLLEFEIRRKNFICKRTFRHDSGFFIRKEEGYKESIIPSIKNVKIFSNQSKVLKVLRNFGIEVLEKTSPLKKFLMKKASGI
jgi:2-polyprenyl-6-methoxyphenol hydroxylase-like FAD-dependent oxidoreductase